MYGFRFSISFYFMPWALRSINDHRNKSEWSCRMFLILTSCWSSNVIRRRLVTLVVCNDRERIIIDEESSPRLFCLTVLWLFVDPGNVC